MSKIKSFLFKWKKKSLSILLLLTVYTVNYCHNRNCFLAKLFLDFVFIIRERTKAREKKKKLLSRQNSLINIISIKAEVLFFKLWILFLPSVCYHYFNLMCFSLSLSLFLLFIDLYPFFFVIVVAVVAAACLFQLLLLFIQDEPKELIEALKMNMIKKIDHKTLFFTALSWWEVSSSPFT